MAKNEWLSLKVKTGKYIDSWLDVRLKDIPQKKEVAGGIWFYAFAHDVDNNIYFLEWIKPEKGEVDWNNPTIMEKVGLMANESF